MSSNKQEIIEHQGRTGEGARPLSGGGGLVRLGRSGGGGREGSPGLVLPRRPKRGLGAGSVVMVEEQAAGRGRSRCACSRGGWRPPIAPALPVAHCSHLARGSHQPDRMSAGALFSTSSSTHHQSGSHPYSRHDEMKINIY